MEKQITYFGQPAKVACDEKCNKAWGISSRPKHSLSNNPDNWEWLSDQELGEAPKDPGTREGFDMKPVNKEGIPNKWCVRECERCVISDYGKPNQQLELPDFSKRIKNIK